LVSFGFLLFLFEKVYKIERVFYFSFLKLKKILNLPQIPIQFFGGLKSIIHLLIIVFPPKLHFLPTKLIIQNCYNLRIQWSKFSTINSIHTRQSSLYFFMAKIKNFKHIYVQKNIKVVQFIENLHCWKVIRPWGVKYNVLLEH